MACFILFFRKKLHTRHFCEVHIGVEFSKEFFAGISRQSAAVQMPAL